MKNIGAKAPTPKISFLRYLHESRQDGNLNFYYMSNQYIYIDDSGDPGFKLARASSRIFVIACVIFDDAIDVEFASASIKMLKKQMGWKQDREFKFHRANEEQKETFFQTVKSLNFRIRAIVVDKATISEPRIKKNDSFYQRIILDMLNRFTEMESANIYLDGKSGKNYRNRSVAKIRQTLNATRHRMASFKLKDSKRDTLVQLADMVAGSIRAKYDPEKTIKRDYLAVIKDKIEDIYIYTD